MTALCSEDGCGRKVECRGLCGKHYMRLRRSGALAKRGRVQEPPNEPRPWPYAALVAKAQVGVGELSRLAGVSGTTVESARTRGLTDRQADRWAVACGLHPSLVWPRWDEAGLLVTDDLAINGNGWRQAWLHAEAHVVAEPEELAA